jgi:hypothetical protein
MNAPSTTTVGWCAKVFWHAFGLALAATSLPTKAEPLGEFYIHYYYCRATPQECAFFAPRSRATLHLPEVNLRRFMGGLIQPPSVNYLVNFQYRPYLAANDPVGLLYLNSEGFFFDQCSPIPMPNLLASGVSTVRSTSVLNVGLSSGCGPDSFGAPPTRNTWNFTDRFDFGAPIRRKAVDGAEFEAAPLVQTREGKPWLTLFWGYKLGLVESQLDWNAVELAPLPAFAGWPAFAAKEQEFVLLRLPPPIIEGEVTEYINTLDFPNAPGGVYFYASTDADRRALDAKLPGRFERTGKRFNHGGYVSVCRFYGSVSPGPNSHFYTANFDECGMIKSLEVKPRPDAKQQLNFEGKVFYANLPIPSAISGGAAACPVASIPLYRAYNAAFGPSGKRNYDSNHRFTTQRADIDEVVKKGWVDEGVVMCVPQ